MKGMLWLLNDIHKRMNDIHGGTGFLHPFHVAIAPLQSYCNLVIFYAP